MKPKIDDRVRYICDDTEEDKTTGHFPPIGTHGTVIDISGSVLRVKWDSGTKGNGEWFCFAEDVEEVYHYRVEVLIGHYCFSCNCDTEEMVMDALNDIFNAMPNTKRGDVDFQKILAEMKAGERISYNECPIAIYRINGERR